MRQKQEALEAQQREQQEEVKAQQQAFFQSKLAQKMDPALAAKFAKQREKHDAGEASFDDRPAANAPPKNLDPVLAKRWTAMQERQAAGEDAAKSIDERVANSKRHDKPE